MPDISDRLFIAIGVSQPGGGLAALPGAITAVQRMTDWATAQGYATLQFHDAAGTAITVDMLRDKMAEAIRAIVTQRPLKRLVIYFVGHGAAQGVGDQYWILSHWKKRPTEAIKVVALQRMLEYYGPEQVAIIGDACQEVSPVFVDLIGSAVLDRPDPEEEQRAYELDQFFAVDTGKQAFMIKAQGEQKDFCLFTEVLLDALEGDAQDRCFELVNDQRTVTSQSLASYLTIAVAREAGKFGLRMTPRPLPGFFSDRVYRTLPDDPPPLAGAGLPPVRPDHNLTYSINPRPTPPSDTMRWQPPPRAGVRRLQPLEDVREALEANRASQDRVRKAQKRSFMISALGAVSDDRFESGWDLSVTGADVVRIDANFALATATGAPCSWYQLLPAQTEPISTPAWSDALVSLADGRIAAVCTLQGFVATLHIVDATSSSLFHRPTGSNFYEGEFTIGLLAQTQAGLLQPEEIIDAATVLRQGKHQVITLGCLAAQLYDSLRDLDSLRSMAAFYARAQQPIPLDIILYGGGILSEANGRLFASIPAVEAREPRTDLEAARTFTYRSTPAIQRHPVAGRVPWMRQAWSAIATAACEDSAKAWRDLALAALPHLAPGQFTTLHSSGRDALLRLSGISLP
jgi:hypothetical protein